MRTLPLAAAFGALAACSVQPPGEAEERARLEAAGWAYRQALWARPWPVLSAAAPLSVYLAHAELGNGDLEAAYARWRAAFQRVPQAGTQPTTAMLGLEHRLDGGAALERTALMLMSDAMNNLLLPGALEARAAAALAAARTRAAEFDAERLRLQTRVTAAFLALAQRDAEVRLVEGLHRVLAVAVPAAAARVGSGGGSQAELLRASVALDRTEADLARLRGGRPALLAALAVPVGTRLEAASPALPEIVPLRAAEASVVGTALLRNPDLERRRREADAAFARLRAAAWGRVPEFSLRSVLSGDGAVDLALAWTLPFLRGNAVEASIREAAAEADAAQALRRQGANDAVAAAVAAHAEASAAEREAEVLTGSLLPRLRQTVDVERARWSVGAGTFLAWVEAQVGVVDAEASLLRLRAAHALARARLQEALGDLAAEP